jgi:tetratricopeptide (TPR) repeat protein
MGSKLAVLAAVIGAAGVASADPAADMKKGIELYKAGKYADAAEVLKRAYDLAPKPETLFALAQAERLAGDCKIAAKHYHKVIEDIGDFNVAKLVQQNLALCEKDEPPPPRSEPEPAQKSEPAAPPPPQIITTIVTHDVPHTDAVAVTFVTFGGIAVGAAGGLYIAATGNRKAAETAGTLDESNRLVDRAHSQQIAAFVTGGMGVALLGYGIYRLVSSDPPKADVAIAPSSTGGAIWVSGRF